MCTRSATRWPGLWPLILVLALGLGRAPGARAQAPAWQQLITGSPAQPQMGGCQVVANAVDASGNVLVVGTLGGEVAFDATILTSSGPNDIFIAK